MSAIPQIKHYFTRQTASNLPRATNPFKELDLSFVIKELRRDKDPDGYAPLDPKYRKWVILPPPGSAAKAPPAATSIFTRSDITIAPDSKKKLNLTEISETESQAFNALYKAIKEGKTPLKISPKDNHFKQSVLSYIIHLMHRPSGRLLLASITSLPHDVLIEKGTTCQVFFLNNNPFTKVELDPEEIHYLTCKSSKGKVLEHSPGFILFAHELIHVLHYDWDRTHVLQMRKPVDQAYGNLEEQFTIAGCPTFPIISENIVRFEFGYLCRVAHIAHQFPPFLPAEKRFIHERSCTAGLNRIQSASACGLLSEVEKLVLYGALADQGLYYSLRYGHSDVLEFLLTHGANPNHQDYSYNSLVHQAVTLKKDSCLSVFLKHKAQINLLDGSGRTPLYLAIDRSYIKGAEILLKHGADINISANNGKSLLARAILKGNAAMVRILLHHGAKIDETSLKALQFLRTLKKKEKKPSKKTTLANIYLRVSLLIKEHLFTIPRNSRRRC